MRDIFALWNQISGFHDPTGTYAVHYGGIPHEMGPTAINLENMSLADAFEQDAPGTGNNEEGYPRSEVTWASGRKWWSDFITDQDLWLKVGGSPTGNRFQGWGNFGNGRYVVDFSKTPSGMTWGQAVAYCNAAAIAAGWDGIHIDTPGPALYGNFHECTPTEIVSPPNHASIADDGYGTEANWATNIQAVATKMGTISPTSASERGGEADELAFSSCFERIKYEGFRFYPVYYDEGDGWSKIGGNNSYWQDWWSGHDWGAQSIYGILQMEALGIIPIVDAIYKSTWSEAKKNGYAMIAVATACLAETALVIYHDYDLPNYNPFTYAHALAAQLGTAEDTATESPAGFWTKHYSNGVVYVNSTAAEVNGVAAYCGDIQLEVPCVMENITIRGNLITNPGALNDYSSGVEVKTEDATSVTLTRFITIAGNVMFLDDENTNRYGIYLSSKTAGDHSAANYGSIFGNVVKEGYVGIYIMPPDAAAHAADMTKCFALGGNVVRNEVTTGAFGIALGWTPSTDVKYMTVMANVAWGQTIPIQGSPVDNDIAHNITAGG